MCAARFALATFHWTGSQRWRREIFFTQRLVERHSLIFILRGKGTAPNQVARPTTLRVPRDTFPQHVQHTGVAILLMDTSPSQLQDFAAQWLERSEIEELLTVIAQVSLRAIAALHAIRSSQFPSGCLVHHQMVADKIEGVAVEPTLGRAVETLSKLAIENQTAQPLAFDDIFQCLRHPGTEENGFGKRISAVMNQDSGRWHASSFKRVQITVVFLACDLDVADVDGWAAKEMVDEKGFEPPASSLRTRPQF